jgi:hypothetical protein
MLHISIPLYMMQLRFREIRETVNVFIVHSKTLGLIAEVNKIVSRRELGLFKQFQLISPASEYLQVLHCCVSL